MAANLNNHKTLDKVLFSFKVFVILYAVIISNLYSQEWVVYEETYITSKIKGSIKKGFILQTASHNIYEVIDYVYLYEYLYTPDVLVLKSDDNYKLYIEEIDDPLLCRKLNDDNNNNISNVTETNINGEFTGFEYNKIYKMTNGQIWLQTEGYYYYYYYFMPSVLIYKSKSVYKMKVEGIDEAIEVRRIK